MRFPPLPDRHRYATALAEQQRALSEKLRGWFHRQSEKVDFVHLTLTPDELRLIVDQLDVGYRTGSSDRELDA